MKRKSKILFAAENPGGFNALVPVIKKFSTQGIASKIFLSDGSYEIAKKNNINFLRCSSLSIKKIEKLLDDFLPDIVVVGTSSGLSLEKKVTAWANKKKIKSVSIIDFWTNYKARFSNPQTTDLVYSSDIICVIDEHMKKQMIAEGFSGKQLRVTGNPFFDTLRTKKSIQEKYILFVCQPFTEIYNRSDSSLDSPIFDEVEIFYEYTRILKKLNIELPILIALHPRCHKKNKFNKIIADHGLKILISKKNIFDLIKKAKLVIGINTIVLFQAAIMGKSVISYQPGTTIEKDPFANIGIPRAVYNYDQLEKQLTTFFGYNSTSDEPDGMERIKQKYIDSNSTQKVINIISNFL